MVCTSTVADVSSNMLDRVEDYLSTDAMKVIDAARAVAMEVVTDTAWYFGDFSFFTPGT